MSQLRQSRADESYARLLGWILDGTLEPGSALPLAELAAELRMSLTPLRESLARLEGEGLVVRLPMRGFRVAEPLSGGDLRLLIEARMVLEPAIARRAARVADASTIARLTDVWRRGAEAPAGRQFEDYQDYLELSALFHETIAEIADNRFLKAAIGTLPVHVQRFRLFGPDGVDDRDIAVAEHRAILEAITARDETRAALAMSLHVERVGGRSSQALSDSAGSVRSSTAPISRRNSRTTA